MPLLTGGLFSSHRLLKHPARAVLRRCLPKLHTPVVTNAIVMVDAMNSHSNTAPSQSTSA